MSQDKLQEAQGGEKHSLDLMDRGTEMIESLLEHSW